MFVKGLLKDLCTLHVHVMVRMFFNAKMTDSSLMFRIHDKWKNLFFFFKLLPILNINLPFVFLVWIAILEKLSV